jgi:hypothetical protein
VLCVRQPSEDVLEVHEVMVAVVSEPSCEAQHRSLTTLAPEPNAIPLLGSELSELHGCLVRAVI